MSSPAAAGEDPPGHDPKKLDLQEPSDSTAASTNDDNNGPKRPTLGGANPAVRFASKVEEIVPTPDDAPVQPEVTSAIGSGDDASRQTEQTTSDAIDEAMTDKIWELSSSLQAGERDQRPLSRFAFEAYSLPASRVASREDQSAGSSRVPTPSRGSPHLRPTQQMSTPPLTPAGSGGRDSEARKPPQGQRPQSMHAAGNLHPSTITPQASTSNDAGSTSPRRGLPPRSISSDQVLKDAESNEREGGHRSHRKGMFEVGGSAATSRESSPSRASQFFSKPMTPRGDANDPYAANKRQPQTRHPDRNTVESRFQFNRRKPGHGTSPSSSSTSLGRHDKRHSGIFGAHHRKHGDDTSHDDAVSAHSRQSSFADLKRFFNRGSANRKEKRSSSELGPDGGTKTPPSVKPGQQRQPFQDDHGLSAKYGKLGKVLGSGAGGKVRLMKRHQDGVVFAVKEFRERYTYETKKDYIKRLTAEFCVGSTLVHGNIIETLDILQEKERWYQVMEYAPYDLFAIVMTGKMSREEITCCFLQILNGVTYLHSSGLAHRDLKLDNVVVSEDGIMKIIDFGSSHVFKYPFETTTIQAKGIVGSDPYLAPEVLNGGKYDAQAVDIWSLAIIFCCMSLRRFPWKVPKQTDNSFKLFAAEPTPGHDPKKLIAPSKSTNDLSNTRPRDFMAMDGSGGEKAHHQGGSQPASRRTSRNDGVGEGSKSPAPQASANHDKPGTAASAQPTAPATAPTSGAHGQTDKKEVIRGPWRVLRVLPRESRHVIGRMLELDPTKRATMDEIVNDAWVANSEICSQDGPGGVVQKAANHTHVLEFPQPPANSG